MSNCWGSRVFVPSLKCPSYRKDYSVLQCEIRTDGRVYPEGRDESSAGSTDGSLSVVENDAPWRVRVFNRRIQLGSLRIFAMFSRAVPTFRSFLSD